MEFASQILARDEPLLPGHCDNGNEFDGRIGLRISSIFVILIGSCLGAIFPVYASRTRGLKVPEWSFFIAKYFGSGVIIATAFIHLLAPANDALTNSCLTGAITEYDWVEGIVLMTIFVLFLIELMVMRYGRFGDHSHEDHEHHDSEPHDKKTERSVNTSPISDEPSPSQSTHAPGDDHLGHSRGHTDIEEADRNDVSKEDYTAQMTAIFILEFGVIFHSIFIGLTLAVAGKEFDTLYVVLCFHQTFEGLGLGSRLAATPWPGSKSMTPYFLALGFGVSTPIAIAIGLGVRNSYPPESATTLIVNGVFDSISAGILIYTGLVELMAHEFMFSNVMRKASLKVVLSAYGCMCLGAGLMALLGKWA